MGSLFFELSVGLFLMMITRCALQGKGLGCCGVVLAQGRVRGTGVCLFRPRTAPAGLPAVRVGGGAGAKLAGSASPRLAESAPLGHRALASPPPTRTTACSKPAPAYPQPSHPPPRPKQDLNLKAPSFQDEAQLSSQNYNPPSKNRDWHDQTRTPVQNLSATRQDA